MIELVPNFSEGRDPAVIAAIAKAMDTVAGCCLLDSTSDPDHHRTVVTAIAQTPDSAIEAALAGVREAVARIDLTRHRGVHPRVGAADVVPLVPMGETPMSAAVTAARRLGQRIGEELGVPVYLYESAALREDRRALSTIRNRGTAFLESVIATDPAWTPDFGPAKLHPTAGACVVGARDFLIAFNILLNTTELGIARDIAARIRASAPGGLPAVRALGFPVPSQHCVQVSVNLRDHRATTLEKVYEWVERLSTMAGITIRETELIGLIPAAATQGFDMARLKIRGWQRNMILEERIAARCR